METRYSVKFELKTMEQVYRIRQSDSITSFADIQRLMDDQFMNKVLEQFKNMSENIKTAFDHLKKTPE